MVINQTQSLSTILMQSSNLQNISQLLIATDKSKPSSTIRILKMAVTDICYTWYAVISSRCGFVGTATWLQVRWPGNRRLIPDRGKRFFSSKLPDPRPDLWPNRNRLNWGGTRSGNCNPAFFLPKNSSFGYWVEVGQVKFRGAGGKGVYVC